MNLAQALHLAEHETRLRYGVEVRGRVVATYYTLARARQRARISGGTIVVYLNGSES